jgi:nucleoside-diphosphate kinase
MFVVYSLPNNNSFLFFKEIARHIRPRTLRALYGKDKMKNAVHCTDLAEDATLEVMKSLKDFSSC